MKRLLAILAFSAFACTAQSALTLSAAPSQVVVSVTISGSGIAALQWFLPAAPVSVAPGPATIAAGKALTCANGGCIVAGRVSILPDGVVAVLTFPASVGALTLSNVMAATPEGNAAALTSGPPLAPEPYRRFQEVHQ